MKKVLVLDIDGTLTNSKKEITKATLEAMIKVQEAGAIIIIASGRPTHGVKHIADALQLEKYGGYILSFNGARIMNAKTREVVYQQVFPKECMAPLLEYANAHDLGMISYEDDCVIAATRIDEHMEFEAGLNHMQLKQVDDFLSYMDFDVNKCLLTASKEVSEGYEKELAATYQDKLSIYRSEPIFIEAMPLGVDKAASLDRLFNLMGVDKEDVVACGDGFNDRSMIAYAGVGVAMANAQDAVKEVADFITDKTNDEDGLLEVVEKFF